ncbi:hypothetical protein [Leptothoe sp. PORK10 BA2]|uniref:hypothetical protein n=1 Tax=Leptothoe sp. PORK10 BA2 TaxID=3110254 RepID=UPI002B20195F|nr:hypothetical protein [Leptothoe sp. PORK10 BA2]MEA5466462.1 hypothetical protein [Leptothoe sp. PORK10 BA2]
MLGALSLAAATAIAKIVLEKFYEGAGGKLGETVVEKASDTVQKLGNLIWEKCFKGKPDDVAQLPEQAAKPEAQADQEKLAAYLGQVLSQDSSLSQDAKKLADELHQVIVTMENVTGRNVQQNFGGQNLQVNDPNQPVIQVQGNPTFHFGGSGKDG